jgi:predicted transcriptional regulator
MYNNPTTNYMKYRDKFEIIVSILESANTIGGVKKTKLMYEAFLSYSQLNEYLSLLVENGLIEIIRRTYKTTEKGLAFLHIYNQIRQLIAVKQNEKE